MRAALIAGVGGLVTGLGAGVALNAYRPNHDGGGLQWGGGITTMSMGVSALMAPKDAALAAKLNVPARGPLATAALAAATFTVGATAAELIWD